MKATAGAATVARVSRNLQVLTAQVLPLACQTPAVKILIHVTCLIACLAVRSLSCQRGVRMRPRHLVCLVSLAATARGTPQDWFLCGPQTTIRLSYLDAQGANRNWLVSQPGCAHASSFDLPGQYFFGPGLLHCQAGSDTAQCKQRCEASPECVSWTFQCGAHSLCCHHGSAGPPVSRVPSACSWAGVKNLSSAITSASNCNKVIIAPLGHVVVLHELPQLGQLWVVHDGLTANAPVLMPSAHGVVRSSQRNLFVAAIGPAMNQPSGCDQEAPWRGRIELEEQIETRTSSPESALRTNTSGATSSARIDVTVNWVFAMIVLFAFVGTFCCAAFFIYLSGMQMAIFVGPWHPLSPHVREQQRLDARQARAARHELAPSSSAERSVLDNALQDSTVLRRHSLSIAELLEALSFVLPPPPQERPPDDGECEEGADVTVGECVICIGEISPSEVCVTLRCNHTFHYECIAEWAERTANCPCCRGNIAARPAPRTADRLTALPVMVQQSMSWSDQPPVQLELEATHRDRGVGMAQAAATAAITVNPLISGGWVQSPLFALEGSDDGED